MLETARDQAFPRIQQISFFLPNKVGTLSRVLDALGAEQIRVCGLAILDSHDHAVVRIVVDRADRAAEILRESGRAICETPVLGVAIDDTDPLAVENLLDCLVRAELNVFFAYSLLVRRGDHAVMAVAVDDVGSACDVLRSGNFELVDQRDLGPDDGGD